MKTTQSDIPKSWAEALVAEIVSDNYHAAGVFREFGLDFCCGGGIPLAEACKKRGVDLESVEEQLNSLQVSNSTGAENYKAWEPSYLIRHIEDVHHRFVRTKIPEITAYAKKVSKVHGSRHPETTEIFSQFTRLSQELLQHLEDEEERVFPLILEVIEARKTGGTTNEDATLKLKREIEHMEADHDRAGSVMRNIRELSNNFTPPVGACQTYRVLYHNLEGFEEDLHKHVHLENNILFSKAAEWVTPKA